jgi:ketosteroid isomerase-like protein
MRNKELVSTFFEHFSAGEIDPAFALVSDDVSWWAPGDLPFSGTKTKEEYLQVVGSIQKGFPDCLELQATGMIAEGNQVVVEVASFGKHVNGKTYTN